MKRITRAEVIKDSDEESASQGMTIVTNIGVIKTVANIQKPYEQLMFAREVANSVLDKDVVDTLPDENKTEQGA